MNLSKTSASPKEINWINALKALCIVFVFFRHSENYYGVDMGWLDSLFLPFYVNGFFFVSGYLLFWKQMSHPRVAETRKEYLKVGGKTLLLNLLFRIIIPSVIFAIIEFFPKKIIKCEPITILDLLIETVGGCTYWFTSALVIAELIFLLLLLTRNRNIWFYAIIAFALSALGRYLFATKFCLSEAYSSFPWQYKHGLLCMCYLACGGVYWKYETFICNTIKKMGWALIPMAVVYFVGCVFFRSYLSNGYMTSLGCLHPVGVIWSIFATVLLIEICRRAPRIHFLTFIGQNSIGFYFMSGALPIVFSLIAKRIVPGSHVVVVFPVFVCCVGVAYLAMKVLTKWAPWLFDLRKVNHYSYSSPSSP